MGMRQKTYADKLACAMAGLAAIARFCRKYGTSATWTPHAGLNRAQRRAVKFQHVGKQRGKPTNTQKPTFL